jgi:hypothetical protein
MKTLCNQLRSKETWKRVLYLMGPKSFEHAKKPLTKEDIFPLILAFILVILLLISGGFLFSKLINW